MEGKSIVYATSMKTEMGKIADMIQNVENEQTPLQRKLEHLGNLLFMHVYLYVLLYL